MPSGVPLPNLVENAIKRGDLTRIRDLAHEAGPFDLIEALQICLLICAKEPHNYERAAKRWLARTALEAPGVKLEELLYMAEALTDAPVDLDEAQVRLLRLCKQSGITAMHQGR